MKATRQFRARMKPVLRLVAILIVVGFVAVLAMRLVTGRGLRTFPSLARALLDSRTVSSYSHGDFTSVIFLHHSTGYNLIEHGGVRERFSGAGYDFWDHGYNPQGLRRPDGSYADYSYGIPDDNTDPDGLAGIFAQRVYRLPWNAFSGLLQHEVIAFKSCFPVSDIASDEQLGRYKSYYLAMRDVMDQHPDKVFIVVTPPPLNPAATDAETAARARGFADWLKSEEYLNGHSNVFTFDFFDHLAEDDPSAPDCNMLRAEYRAGTDSHPNQTANETIGPIFVDFITHAVQEYRAAYQSESTG